VNTLRAGSLVLEPQLVAHAAEMFAVLSDPAIYEFENAPPESLAWLERRFAELESRASADGAQRWLNWVVRLPTGALAGYVQATIMRDRGALIAYELASKHWRQGIGSGAVRTMLEELASTYRVSAYVAVVKTANYRSLALLRSLGFRQQSPVGAAAVTAAADEILMYKAAD
jgi:RimJ/RimL family protein N-acetyltransferase